MASVINQIKLGNIEYAIAHSAYAECDTSALDPAKTATICTNNDTGNTAFTLIKGVSVQVKFNHGSSLLAPTLNINSTGDKSIYYKGEPFQGLKAKCIYTFVYNGEQWELVGEPDTNTDTGATSIYTAGAGNAITDAIYNPSNRQITVTKGITFATKAEIDSLISHGTDDPSSETTSQYYFKYN